MRTTKTVTQIPSDEIASQLLKNSRDLLAGKLDTNVSKEYSNIAGKLMGEANLRTKQNERGHYLAIPFFGITSEMEREARKPQVRKTKPKRK